MDRIDWIVKAIGQGVMWAGLVFAVAFLAILIYTFLNRVAEALF